MDINCTTSSQDVNFTLSVENCSSGQIEEIFPGPHDAYKVRFIRDTGLFRLDAPAGLERAMKIIVCELPDGQHGRKRGRSFRIQSIFSCKSFCVVLFFETFDSSFSIVFPLKCTGDISRLV